MSHASEQFFGPHNFYHVSLSSWQRFTLPFFTLNCSFDSPSVTDCCFYRHVLPFDSCDIFFSVSTQFRKKRNRQLVSAAFNQLPRHFFLCLSSLFDSFDFLLSEFFPICQMILIILVVLVSRSQNNPFFRKPDYSHDRKDFQLNSFEKLLPHDGDVNCAIRLFSYKLIYF